MFSVTKADTCTKARTGVFETQHGAIQTPSFFPVATQGAVKGLCPKELDQIGVQGLLVNAYHIFLRPGVEIVKKCGGLHKFMGFGKTIITDSGGYQIFSLERLRKVSDEGVEFQSHIDGRSIFLSPEEVIGVQLGIGSDVVVPLDECCRFPTPKEYAHRATERTIEWARRSKDFFQKHKSSDVLFMGIIQGSTYSDLRKQCLEAIVNVGVDGLCIGGLSVGEPEDLRYNILSFIEGQAPQSYLRYFMGYGKPHDIVEAVSLGIDLFDCIIPTRFGRTGTVYTDEGKIVVRNSPYTEDSRPLDGNCPCYVCRNFSRAYLRHLINANEMLGPQLLTYHNIFWYKHLMEKIRTAIKEDRFAEFKKQFLSRFKEEQPITT
ncbi:MAG: tRNA guanosine(34) transglycosylase Tgt [Candidatus Omnitrophota bacterium]|nr:MAG: tRNA guanosine(34) transglycosylase Tgt [Candidatus Omnitrophota bacterium]